MVDSLLPIDEREATRKKSYSTFAQAEAPGIVLATLLFHPLENVGMQFSEDMPVWFLDMIKKLEKV